MAHRFLPQAKKPADQLSNPNWKVLFLDKQQLKEMLYASLIQRNHKLDFCQIEIAHHNKVYNIKVSIHVIINISWEGTTISG